MPATAPKAAKVAPPPKLNANKDAVIKGARAMARVTDPTLQEAKPVRGTLADFKKNMVKFWTSSLLAPQAPGELIGLCAKPRNARQVLGIDIYEVQLLCRNFKATRVDEMYHAFCERRDEFVKCMENYFHPQQTATILAQLDRIGEALGADREFAALIHAEEKQLKAVKAAEEAKAKANANVNAAAEQKRKAAAEPTKPAAAGGAVPAVSSSSSGGGGGGGSNSSVGSSSSSSSRGGPSSRGSSRDGSRPSTREGGGSSPRRSKKSSAAAKSGGAGAVASATADPAPATSSLPGTPKLPPAVPGPVPASGSGGGGGGTTSRPLSRTSAGAGGNGGGSSQADSRPVTSSSSNSGGVGSSNATATDASASVDGPAAGRGSNNNKTRPPRPPSRQQGGTPRAPMARRGSHLQE